MNVVTGSMPETKERWRKYFPKGSHGLIAFDPSGKPQSHIEGHMFGKEEILAEIKKVETK